MCTLNAAWKTAWNSENKVTSHLHNIKPSHIQFGQYIESAIWKHGIFLQASVALTAVKLPLEMLNSFFFSKFELHLTITMPSPKDLEPSQYRNIKKSSQSHQSTISEYSQTTFVTRLFREYFLVLGRCLHQTSNIGNNIGAFWNIGVSNSPMSMLAKNKHHKL